VNPGNSGGPLFNLAGEVVGINSQIYSQSGGYMGLSFAIPIDMANDVREQLVKNGRVTRSKIGIAIQNMPADLAEALGLDRPRGALVGAVDEGGPADKAGIKSGDVILSVDGKPVDTNAALPVMISSMRPGTTTELEIWSDRKLRKVTARVVEKDDDAATPQAPQGRGGSGSNKGEAQPTSKVLGMSLRQLTPAERQDAQTQGSLVVEEVDGAAEEAGIQPGDIILGAASGPAKTVAELQAAIAAAKRLGSRNVALNVKRGDRQVYLAIRLE
jgi:serine protease Do